MRDITLVIAEPHAPVAAEPEDPAAAEPEDPAAAAQPQDPAAAAQPGDPVAGEVEAALAGWTKAGLIRPFLWYSGERDGDHHARWSGHGDDEPVPVLRVLSQEEYRVIRLVSLLLVPSAGHAHPAGVREAAEAVEAAVTDRLAGGQRLYRVNLLVAATGVTGLPGDLLSTYWDANVVAADEDRITSRHLSDVIRHPGAFVPHAALALASAGGLWPGMPTGPFDDERGGAGEQCARVRVMRSFARAVRSHGLVHDITALMFDQREQEEWLGDALGAVPARDPGLIVATAAREYLDSDGSDLRYASYVPTAPPARVRVSPWDAFKALWAFMGRRALQLPREWTAEIAEGVVKAIEETAQEATYGEDSTVVVRLRPQATAEQPQPRAPLSADIVEFAEALLTRIGRAPRQPAFSRAWRALRALAFGLVDAGELPEGCGEPLDGGQRAIVTDVAMICPDPREPPFDGGSIPAASEPINPCDPAQARLVARLLKLSQPAAGVAVDPDAAPPALEQWLAARRQSLLWLVGDRIAEGVEEAEAALTTALETVRQKTPASEPDPDLTRGLQRRFLAVTLAAIGGLILAGVLGVRDASPPVIWGIALLSVVGWLVGQVATFYGHLKRQFQLLHRRNEFHHRRAEAMKGAERAAAELLRLAAAYREHQEWAAIIGHVLHRPAGALLQAPDDTIEPDDLGLPSALRLVTARTDDRGKRRLAAIAGKRCFHPGWLASLYAGIERDSMDELRFVKGQASGDAAPDPDVDPRARHHLLADVEGGTAGERVARRMRQTVAEQVSKLEPNELFSTLRGLDGQALKAAGGRHPRAEELLTEVCLRSEDQALDESFARRLWVRRPRPVDTTGTPRVWLPPTIRPPGPSVLAESMDTTFDEDSSVLMLRAVRLDVTEPALWSDLLIFSAPHEERTPPPTPDLGPIG